MQLRLPLVLRTRTAKSLLLLVIAAKLVVLLLLAAASSSAGLSWDLLEVASINRVLLDQFATYFKQGGRQSGCVKSQI